MQVKKGFLATALATLTVLCFSFTVPATDFSGSWALNEGKSELGQYGANSAAKKMKIEQGAESVKIVRTVADMDGTEKEITETLSEDKASTITIANMTKKSQMKWAGDKQGFTVNAALSVDFGGQNFDLTSVETWSLSADGNTLTVSVAVSTPQGEINIKTVYDKK